MNPRQTEYFRRKLLRWREEILRGSGETLRQLKEEDTRLPDQSDWASAEIQRSFELKTRDRERKLLSKIDAALRRIEDGSYGYCEETQEPIGIRRLEARPIATLSIEAQGAPRAARAGLPRGSVVAGPLGTAISAGSGQ
jgi:DnaK suppressor protein